MASLNNKSEDILKKLEENGSFKELSPSENAHVTTTINNEMRSIKRDFNRRESESVQSASKIILTA